jgi:poly(A) polymerase
MMQPRFERRQGNAVMTLVEQPRFRAGFDFLRLRGDAGEVDAELANWWEDFSLADEEGRRALLETARSREPVRRLRSAPRSASAGVGAEAGAETSEGATPEFDPARKRRRRRRKPSGEGGAVAPAPPPGDA